MLARIPQELIPFVLLPFGGLILVIVTLAHGLGLDQIVARYQKRAAQLRRRNLHPSIAVFVFGGTILMMLVLHIAEICFWGGLLHWGGLIANFHEATYFAANTYTTLGMGEMALPSHWHELSPIIAISGLFTFAWTTSEMFNIIADQRRLVSDIEANRSGNGAAAKSGSS